MVEDIQLRRLKDVAVKGNFTINCHDEAMYMDVLGFLYNPKASQVIRFKDIPEIGRFQKQLKEDQERSLRETGWPLLTLGYAYVRCRPPFRFIIKYESLNELLKLREIFNIRASKFDTYLIEKRGYNPFTEDFFDRCADKTIYKVKK